MKSRSSRIHPDVFRYLGSRVRKCMVPVFLLPALAFSLVAAAFVSPAQAALGPSATEIGLPEDASPEDVLDRLCSELKKQPGQSIDMAEWALSYFDQQIRNTPAFATALGIVFVDCLASAQPGQLGGVSLAQQISSTLLAIYVNLQQIPNGSLIGGEVIAAALATMDPELAAEVLALLGSSGIKDGIEFGNVIPPTGGAAPTPTPTPSVTPLPTPTPPVTPVLNS